MTLYEIQPVDGKPYYVSIPEEHNWHAQIRQIHKEVGGGFRATPINSEYLTVYVHTIEEEPWLATMWSYYGPDNKDVLAGHVLSYTGDIWQPVSKEVYVAFKSAFHLSLPYWIDT